VWREKGFPDTSSASADEGTAAHFLRDLCLCTNVDAEAYIGRVIGVWPDGADWWAVGYPAPPAKFTIDAEMAAYVQSSADSVRRAATGGALYSEQGLSIASITGEQGATGTSDAVIVFDTELTIDDLKYGKGLQVFAEEHEQLLIYGAAALEEFDVLGDIKTLRMRISQPRLNHEDEWVLPVEEVQRRVIEIRQVADKIMSGPDGLEATPGEKQCRFCKAKASCEEYRNFVLGAVADDFVDLNRGETLISPQDVERVLASAYGVAPGAVTIDSGDFPVRFAVAKPSILPQLASAEERIANSDDQHLATCMDAVDMVEQWCKAVRAEVERRLLAGSFSDGRYKLVEGRKGARGWLNVDEAEAALKAMRLKVDQMYDFKVKTPPALEKVIAAANPRKWAKLQPLIGQTQGKPSVAPASDKRPALQLAIAEQFEVITDDLI
jgi:hypothetical protein